MIKLTRILDEDNPTDVDYIWLAKSTILMLETRIEYDQTTDTQKPSTGTTIHTGFAIISVTESIDTISRMLPE